MRNRWSAAARGLAVVAVGLGAACAQPAPLPQSHVERVVDDVTAIVEGMSEAHTGPSGLAELPELRYPLPRS